MRLFLEVGVFTEVMKLNEVIRAGSDPQGLCP